MKLKGFILIQAILACSVFTLLAQTEVEVPEPRLSLNDGKVQIDYILRNTTASEKFTISIEVSTESGNTIVPRSLTGDVGLHVAGGSTRTILWDIEADEVFLDEEIYVQVIALPEAPPVLVAPPPAEEKEPETDENEAVADEDKPLSDDKEAVAEEVITRDDTGEATFSRTGLIVQSVIFPGLGLSRYKGKPHWIKGVAAYGCLAGSIYFNRLSYNSYQSYLGSDTPWDADEMFDQALSQDDISQILAYSAIGIWVADLVWTILGTSDLNKQSAANRKGISIDTTVEPLSNVPMLALRYRF